MMTINNGIRDIHYVNERFANQKAQFQKDTSAGNYSSWNIFESWLIGRGRKPATLLKQLGAFKRIIRMYPIDDVQNITYTQMIDINRAIVSSKYKTGTKISMQLLLRSYLTLFADETRKKEIAAAIQILSDPKEDNPINDEYGKVITPADFEKIEQNMPNHDFSVWVKVLYSTGMRVTELYNIMPNNVEFVNKTFIGIKLPPQIFGYKGGWIFTRGKRTRSKKEGKYMYYLPMYVNEFNHYLNDLKKEEYICKYSYSHFLQSLHESVKKSGLKYRVHPHMFRHTVATRLFKKHPDAVVKKVLNWSKGSNMSTHYSHINKHDIEEAMT